MKRTLLAITCLTIFGVLAAGAASAQITQIIDASGDGTNPLDAPPRTSSGIAVDSSGNAYVTGSLSDNAFKIAPGGTITEIIDSAGDGANPLALATGIAVDSAGNVYVAGRNSNNVFKIDTPGTCSTGGTPCTITEIIDSTGDGANAFLGSLGIAVDGSDNVYVTGSNSDNAFKIDAPVGCSTGGTPCTITKIIDSTGDGSGNPLDNPRTIAVDSSGNVYVPGWFSDNAFQIASGGTITEIIDAAGDGTNILDKPVEITVDGSGNVYLTAEGTNSGGFPDDGNAFRIATPAGCSTAGPTCTITEIIDENGDGSNIFRGGEGVAVDGSGNVYLTGFLSDTAFKIDTPGTCSTGGTPCTITEIIDLAGDGTNAMDGPVAIAVDGSGIVYVSAFFTDNAFQIGGDAPPTAEANGPYSGGEGVAIAVDATGSSDDLGIDTYEWDCTDDGTYDVSSANPTGSGCTYGDQGVFTVRLRVTDTSSQTAEDTAEVTVTNADPTISDTSNDGAVEGGSSTITVTAGDVPADTLSYEFDCDGNGAYGDAGDAGPQAGNSASCSFADDGAFTVNVRVTDGDGGSATDSTVVTVTNADPVISATTNDGAVEGGSSTITVTASDVPADTLSYEFDCDGNGAYGDAGDVAAQPGNSASCSFADDGAFTVNVRVTDGDGGTATDSTVVTVTNADPVISATTNDGAVEGGSSTITVTASDVPADTLSYEFDCDGNGAYGDAGDAGPQAGNSASCSFADDGAFTVNVRVTDGDGGTATDSTVVTVTNADPVISATTNDGAVEGGSSTITVTASDVPADTLSYEFDCDGNGAYGDAGDVAAQPGNSASCSFADDGAFTVNVRVTDGDGGTATDSTVVTVTNADPVLTVTNATVTVDEGDTAINDGTYSDTGADDVTVSAAAAGSISPATSGNSGSWNWSFDTTDGPDESQTITITGDDEDGGSGNVTFELVVNNVAPTATDNSYTTLEDAAGGGNVITDDTGAGVDSDPGDDVLTVIAFDATSVGGGTVAVAGTGEFTYTPAADFCGPDSFDYTIDDDEGATSSATVSIDVTCVNDEPSFSPVSAQNVDEDAGPQVVAGFVTASAGPAGGGVGDETGQALTFNVTGNTNPALFSVAPAVGGSAGNLGELTYTSAANAFGSAQITIELMDDGGTDNGGDDTSPPQTFTITVDNVNDPPSFITGGNVISETGTGEQTLAWATGISVGAANENQTPVFTVTSDCVPSLLLADPSIDPDGTLRFTPDDLAIGSCTVSATLSDGVESFGPVDFTLELVTASKPIADPDSVTTDGGAPLSITLTGSDPDGQVPLAFQVIEPVTDLDSGAIISDSGPFRGELLPTAPPNATDTSAEVLYTPEAPFVSNTVILATGGALLDDKVQVLSGDVVVNDAGGSLTLEKEATTPAGFAVKADLLTTEKKAIVGGDAFCNTLDDSDSDSDPPPVCAPLTLPAFDPNDDPLPPFRVGDVGANEVTVAKKGSASLTPGLYGDIYLDDEATLTFAPGNYSVRSIITEKKSILEFSGATEIKVAQRMRTGKDGFVGQAGLADQVFFYVAGADSDDDSDKDCDSDSDGPPKAADIGKDSRFYANVYAGNGSIVICEDAVATGAFLGHYVEVQKEAQVSLANGFPEPPDQFEFEVTDEQGLVSDRATVLINEDPSCRNDAGQVVAIAAYAGAASTDGAASIDITLSGCESTGVPVTVTATDGTQGTVTGLPAGPAGPPYEFVVTYTPTDSVPNNRDSFDFTFDNGSSSATATVEINQPPCELVEANSENAFATDEGNPLTITLSGCDPDDGVLAFGVNDANLGDNCATCALSAPSSPIPDTRPGHTSVNVIFTHSEVAGTTAAFDYSVTGDSGSDTRTISIEVSPVPVPPVAEDDAFSGTIGGLVTGDVTANDSDANNDPLTVTLDSGPSQASNFTLNPDGTFVYTHNGTFNLSDSFDYSLSDGTATADDTATASITLGAISINVTLAKAGPAGSENSRVFTEPSGIDCGNGCPSQTAVFALTQFINLEAEPAPGFLFDSWTGDADCADGLLEPIGDRSCTANFVADPGSTPVTVMVTLAKAGSGSGTVTSSPAGVNCGPTCTLQGFMVATTVEERRVLLLPSAAPGSVFAGFSPGPGCPDPGVLDCGCGDGLLDGDLPASCTATFDQAPRILTIVITGSGSITGNGIGCSDNPCSAAYSDGTLVTLSGSSDSSRDPSAVTWSGACTADGTFQQKATVLMDGDKTCNVNFN